ncbi:hypothetical protein HHI36_022197 [Cryptolaemus montrouzieri]|uniref:Uncharacterized protein n=1 Tax=Cryptolaemus montrouzieri TaxID=559131 RepID=A0ABD2MZC6_9CUCU
MKMMFPVLITLVCAVVLTAAEEIDKEKIVKECTDENGLKQEDFDNWMKDQDNPTEKMLCFMKCCHEKDGSLKKDGKWDIEALGINTKTMLFANDSVKAEIRDCFSKVPPVKTCADMKAAHKCVPESKLRNCTAEFNVMPEDFEKFEKEPENASEKMLCYIKCNSEVNNMINADGIVNLKLLTDFMKRNKNLKDKEKMDAEKCLGDMKPVKSCADVKPFIHCMYDLKMF